MPRLADESLAEHLARLEREREEADRRYNEALTALDRAVATLPALPDPPPAYDASRLEAINRTWDTLPGGPPAVDGSLKGRLRAFIWRLVGPSLEAQRAFNAALVDHLNRNAGGHEESARAMRVTIDVLRAQVEGLVRFETHLILYLQTMTLFVDTRDRLAAGGAEVLNAGLSAVTDEWLKRWESLSTRESRLNGRVEAVMASLNDLRATTAIAQQTALSLKREVERAVGGGAASGPAPATPAESRVVAAPVASASVDLNSFKYLGFENAFRGAPDEIRRRLEAYAPTFVGQQDVLDLGCGRGEFLDVLRAAGISARGIDINAAMVEEARARGLAAEQADALSHLRSLESGAVGGIFAAQVIEHLAPDYLAALVEETARVMRPGGRIVLETINPTSWVAFFESYIRDITHVRPLHPETMQYMLRVSGFKDVTIQFSAPVAPDALLARAPEPPHGQSPDLADVVRVINDNVERLNGRLFGPQDYAVIGTA
jgi:SAM-dependent methyltransferase